MSDRDETIDDATLHAYVDDRLNAAERGRVEAYLLRSPEAAARVTAWQEQADALRQHYAPQLDETMPAMLGTVFLRPTFAERTGRLLPRIAALLLVAALGAGLGWWGRGAVSERHPQVAAAPLSREAARAHLLYTAEVLHPVEVPAAEEKHLVAWLSKRLGTQLKAPYLAEAGFSLIGGRLLPAASNGAAAQFMYENKRGERLTLYVRSGEPGTDTAFHFNEQNGAAGFYWIDGGYGYALVGALERDKLLPIARAVYAQLN
ncbi:anti-sigma factor family protein [Ferrovibrio sp.]|uniref:anti-sigma factor family protein n=1 Tax=Ferrovibrio sp. TaxID=1917215 RepID=UPI003D0A8228